MVAWETLDDELPFIKDYAKTRRAADKIVFSRSLETVSSEKTRIQRSFDPPVIRRMKAETGRDISVGGPELAGQAIRAGLVDEVQLFLSPVVVVGGTRALPDGVRVILEFLDERRFDNGVVYLEATAPPLALRPRRSFTQ